MWKIFLIEFIIVAIVSAAWVYAIDKMSRKHPDYKGEDFLNEEKLDNENDGNR